MATLKRVPWVPNSPSSFRVYTNGVKSWEIVDPYTLRLKTEKVYPLLPLDLSTINIVSKAHEQSPTVDFNGGRAAVGTGPFKFVEYMPGERIVLARNDQYWGPKPAWSRVTMKLITNNSARVAALLAGDVQLIEYVPATDYAQLKANANINVSQVVGNRFIYLHLDSFRDETPFATDKGGNALKKNPLKDVRVRKALSKAISREAITQRVMEGLAIPAGGLMADGFFGASPKLKPESLDVEGAKKLLADAGYPNGFGLTIHGPNDRYPNDAKVLQAIGPMFNRIGVETKVVTQPWSVYASQGSQPQLCLQRDAGRLGCGYGRSVIAAARGAGDGQSRGRQGRLQSRPLFQPEDGCVAGPGAGHGRRRQTRSGAAPGDRGSDRRCRRDPAALPDQCLGVA